MKTLAFFLLSALAAAGQTNFTYDVFHTPQADYTNATILRTNAAYIVVSHLDGISKVALTNLFPEQQAQFGYDPKKAAAALTAEKKRAEDQRAAAIAHEKYLKSLRGIAQAVQCTAVLDTFGMCQIQSTNGSGKVYMMGLPPRVKTFLDNLQQLRNAVAQQSDYADSLARRAARADANAPAKSVKGDVTFVNAQLAKRRKANNLALDAKDAADKLKAMKKQLEEMENQLVAATTFYACPTGIYDSGIPRWQAVQ